MVSRLRVMCLSLGILSTVVGCAAPPPMAPLRATLAPAAPAAAAPPATPAPADLLPAGEPLPSVPPTLYEGHKQARHLPILPLRAEDG